MKLYLSILLLICSVAKGQETDTTVIYFTASAQAQQNILQFRFKHNTKNLKRTTIQFGGMFQHTTAPEKVTNAQTLGVNIVRTNVNFYAWNGTNSPESDTLTSHGITNFLNVNEIPADGSGYATIDTAAYAAHLTTLAAHSDPSKVAWVPFNEMGNLAYWGITATSDLVPYIQCAKIAVRIGHQHGFKVYDGGLMANECVYWTYRQMSNAHDADTVNFLKYCVPLAYQFGVMHRTNAAVNLQVDITDYLLTQFVGVGFDGNNVHLYLPFVKSFVDTATNYSTSYTGLDKIFYYLRQHTTLPIICNEFGLLDPAYTAPTLADLRKNKVAVVIYYNDNEQTPIYTILDDANALTSFGSYYKTQIQ